MRSLKTEPLRSSSPPPQLLPGDSIGPLSMMPPRLALRVLECADPTTLDEGTLVVQQYHHATEFYFLLQGQLDFHIFLQSEEREFLVSQTEQPWTPVGWSGFRDPHRYATSVRTKTRCRLLRFSFDNLDRLFQDEPDAGRYFFDMVASTARQLLLDARERLLGSLRLSSTTFHWATKEVSGHRLDETLATEVPASASRTEHLGDRESLALESRIRSEESIVTNAAPQAEEVLNAAGYFEDFPDQFTAHLAKIARTHYFCRGDLIKRQGIDPSDFMILANGRLRVEYGGSSGRTAILGFIRDRGEVVGSGLLPSDVKNDVSIRATRDGALLAFDRQDLMELFDRHPLMGLLFYKKGLWLLSRRLRGTRARLVSEEFDQEVLAVENLIEQARTELRVSSELHKLPHLLKAPVTLVDALRVVDSARTSPDRVERQLGKLAHELLLPVRREQRFFSALTTTFEEVVGAPLDSTPGELRRLCAENFIRVFSQIPYRIAGLEKLPRRAGHIFIFNHLKNHEYNTLPNGFQLTLDSHFISSMILHKTYSDPGVRVVRRSRAEEYGHHAYYERLGHVSVYTRESDTPGGSRGERFGEFLRLASTHLERGTNLVLAPEGTSRATEESPGRFKAGAFRLAAALANEPFIVPVAVAHFDRRLDHTTLCAMIQEPFRISDKVPDAENPAAMKTFLEHLQFQFRIWVKDAARLAHSPERVTSASFESRL